MASATTIGLRDFQPTPCVRYIIPDRYANLRVRRDLRQFGGTGARGTRTPDLLHAMQTRSQLRHGPGSGDYGSTSAWLQHRLSDRPLAGQIPMMDAKVMVPARSKTRR